MLRPVYPFGEKSKRFEWQSVMIALVAKPQRTTILEGRTRAKQGVRSLQDTVSFLETDISELQSLGYQLADKLLQIQGLRERLPQALIDCSTAEFQSSSLLWLLSTARMWNRLNKWPSPLRWFIARVITVLCRRKVIAAIRETPAGQLRDYLENAIDSPVQLRESLESLAGIALVLDAENAARIIERDIKASEPLSDLQYRHAILSIAYLLRRRRYDDGYMDPKAKQTTIIKAFLMETAQGIEDGTI